MKMILVTLCIVVMILATLCLVVSYAFKACAADGGVVVEPAIGPVGDNHTLLGLGVENAKRTDFFQFFFWREAGREKDAQGRAVVLFAQPTDGHFAKYVKLKTTLDAHDKIAKVELRVARSFVNNTDTAIFARDIIKSVIEQSTPKADQAAVAPLTAELLPPAPRGGVQIMPKKLPEPDNPSSAYQVIVGKRETAEITLSQCAIHLTNTANGQPESALVVTIGVKK